MPFQILLRLKDGTIREDLPVYFGAVPSPGEVMTLEIGRRVKRVRVTEISGGKGKKVSASPMYSVRAIEI